MIISLRSAKKILELVFITGFVILIGLDICIQIDAYFISKSLWKPPLLTWLVIVITFLFVGRLMNQLFILLNAYPQLWMVLIGIIRILLRMAYNLWRRREKPEYIVIKELAIARYACNRRN